MTRHLVEVGTVSIEGLSRAPSSAHAWTARVQRALAAALRREGPRPPVRPGGMHDIPLLRVDLPADAGEADVAGALAEAIRKALYGVRRTMP